MLKLALLLGAALVLWRLAFGEWPWAMAATSRRPTGLSVRDTAEARRILGVSKQASRDDIILAHRRLVGELHPDKGGDAMAAARANAARDLLIGRPAQGDDAAKD